MRHYNNGGNRIIPSPQYLRENGYYRNDSGRPVADAICNAFLYLWVGSLTLGWVGILAVVGLVNLTSNKPRPTSPENVENVEKVGKNDFGHLQNNPVPVIYDHRTGTYRYDK